MTFKARIQFFIIPDTQDLLKWLCHEAQISNLQLEKLIDLGCLYIDKKRITTINQINNQPGQIIRLHLDPKLYNPELLNQIEVIANHTDWLLAFKPAGIPTHETLDNIQQNVKAILQNKFQIPLYPLFRLDVGTQGLLLMAKNKDFAKIFNQFQEQQLVSKRYWAFTSKPKTSIEKGVWVDYMKKSIRSPREMINQLKYEQLTVLEKSNYKKCQLQILSYQMYQNFFQWDIDLHTGRTHQIRCQMQQRNFPLLGDQIYGGAIHSNLTHEVLGLICYHLSWPSQGHGSRHEFTLSRDRIPKLLSSFV